MEGHEKQPGERPDAPRKDDSGDAPRTDLPPTREPYYEGYFGTGDDEEKIRGEREVDVDDDVEIPDDPGEKRTPRGEAL